MSITSKSFGNALIVGAYILSATTAYAWDPVNDVKKAAKAVTPQITVPPLSLTRMPSATVSVGSASVQVTTDPSKPIPKVHIDDNGELAKGVNAVSDIATFPQELPAKAVDAAEEQAQAALNHFIDDLKAKFWAQIDEWKKLAMTYLPYVYLAMAALIAILMLPGFIGALFAIWVVRSMDRRRARRQERDFKKALAVVKSHGDEIHAKLAA